MAKQAGGLAFSNHAQAVDPLLAAGKLAKLKNQYWNAMKHARDRFDSIRDDLRLFSDFDDHHNDHILFVGWFDYAAAELPMPIEAQVFQFWYFACYPEKLDPAYPLDGIEQTFTNLAGTPRSHRKLALRRKIAWARRQKFVMADPRTDRRPLVLRGPIEVS